MNVRRLYFSLLLLTVFLGACEIAEPALPHFTTPITIPFASQEVLLEDLLDEEGLIEADENSGLWISFEGESLRVELEQNLSVDLPETRAGLELGTFDVSAGEALAYDYTLLELYPESEALPPGEVEVPAFEFELTPDRKDVAGVESAHLIGGELRALIINGLQVPISGASEPELLRCELRDPQSGLLLTTIYFESEIAAGASASSSVDLAGLTLPDSLDLRILGGSPGASAVQDVDVSSSIDLEVELADLIVDEALAEVEPQDFSETRGITLGDSLRVLEAEIEQGELEIEVRNGLSIPCTATLLFEELYDAGGLPLRRVIPLEAGDETVEVLDLAGTSILAPGAELLDSLTYHIEMSSPGSGGEVVYLAASDSAEAVIAASSLDLASVTGTFPEESFDIDPVEEELSIPSELESFQLREMSLVIEVWNELGIHGELELRIESTRADGSSSHLEHFAPILASRGSEAEKTVITLDENNSNIIEVLNGTPDSIELSGRVRVGGDDEIGTAAPGQGASIFWSLEAPLLARVEAGEIELDPMTLDLEEDTRRLIEESMESVSLLAEVENHLPLDLDLYFLTSSDSSSVYESPESVIGPFSITAAPRDPESGFVSEALQSQEELILAQDDILDLVGEGRFIALRLELPGSGGESVAFRADDYLEIRGLLSAEVSIMEGIQ
ncbi:MAG: hypothetical protein QF492_01310 [Candidatus Krumholzibacteria bacterium]|jgi:hypothetical protein|nr:hypothetical protein [Candidatus Krumholzibacteria bacterium]MDP6668530.1 hypothetical protein [Candidatus Krumholzibacteria bacterium]MDP6797796.1 hypothetical protein [Candidatus Krumholzibacteria bacterium]MDP7021411.1 hypothetical protein [Candidatus Krumholzibacteria bacterium]